RILESRSGDGPWHLLLAGDGAQAEAYRDRGSRELKRVRFLGKVGDIRPLLRAADLLVHASLTEGMSNIVLEAMASGLPVVGSMIPGIKELVEDGRTGVMVAPRDSQALAEALISLFTTPERMIDLGTRARVVVEQRFGLTRMLDAYEELYDCLTHA
ncbi:MAG TPA: glycosyltransferase, partial [Burkholderiales bacterium]